MFSSTLPLTSFSHITIRGNHPFHVPTSRTSIPHSLFTFHHLPWALLGLLAQGHYKPSPIHSGPDPLGLHLVRSVPAIRRLPARGAIRLSRAASHMEHVWGSNDAEETPLAAEARRGDGPTFGATSMPPFQLYKPGDHVFYRESPSDEIWRPDCVSSVQADGSIVLRGRDDYVFSFQDQVTNFQPRKVTSCGGVEAAPFVLRPPATPVECKWKSRVSTRPPPIKGNRKAHMPRSLLKATVARKRAADPAKCGATIRDVRRKVFHRVVPGISRLIERLGAGRVASNLTPLLNTRLFQYEPENEFPLCSVVRRSLGSSGATRERTCLFSTYSLAGALGRLM